MADTFSPELLARLDGLATWGHGIDYDNLLFHLDLEGYDVTDPDIAADYIREITAYRRQRRAKQSILATIATLKLYDKDIGAAIGMPRSTVQAMATGRVPERFTRKEKARLVALVRQLKEICDEALARLGVEE